MDYAGFLQEKPLLDENVEASPEHLYSFICSVLAEINICECITSEESGLDEYPNLLCIHEREETYKYCRMIGGHPVTIEVPTGPSLVVFSIESQIDEAQREELALCQIYAFHDRKCRLYITARDDTPHIDFVYVVGLFYFVLEVVEGREMADKWFSSLPSLGWSDLHYFLTHLGFYRWPDNQDSEVAEADGTYSPHLPEYRELTVLEKRVLKAVAGLRSDYAQPPDEIVASNLGLNRRGQPYTRSTVNRIRNDLRRRKFEV